jgi:hypothetical protein
MFCIEPCGFSDPNKVEKDLKQLLANTPYYDKIRFVYPQRKMCTFLETGRPAEYLRVSVDIVLLTGGKTLDAFSRLGEHYDLEVVPILWAQKGTAQDMDQIEFDAFFVAPPWP